MLFIPFLILETFVKIDEKIKSDSVIKELFELAGKNVPEQVIDRDEIRNELDELNEGIFFQYRGTLVRFYTL